MRYYHTYEDMINAVGVFDTADLYLCNRLHDCKVDFDQFQSFIKALEWLDYQKSSISIADDNDLVWLKNHYQACHQLGYLDTMAPLMEESLFGRAYLSAAKKNSGGLCNDYSHCQIPSAKEIFATFKLIVKRHTQKYGEINGISKYAKYLED